MTDLITVEGGPERFFRVSRPTADGEVISSSLPAGPWLNGPSGRPLAGALGVLIDNVAGYVLVLGRPPGGWSVSAEITLDLMGPLPSDGSVLTAQGIVRHADDVGGFASASITDPSGRLVAVCTQHGRWLKGPPVAGDDVPPSTDVIAGTSIPARTSIGPPPGEDLASYLGGELQTAEGGALFELTVTPELTNPLGNLHGGVTLCACDLVAQAAVSAAGGPARTASIHVAYPRPVPAGAQVRFAARVMHLGRAFGVVRVTAHNDDNGKLFAIATVTMSP
jgi:uncharacterized protein (TIGR00369 family)